MNVKTRNIPKNNQMSESAFYNGILYQIEYQPHKHMKNKIESINKLLKAINAKNKGTQDTKSFTNEDI